MKLVGFLLIHLCLHTIALCCAYMYIGRELIYVSTYLSPAHKYFPLLEVEKGIEAVESLFLRAQTPKVKQLASRVITLFRAKPSGPEDMDADTWFYCFPFYILHNTNIILYVCVCVCVLLYTLVAKSTRSITVMIKLIMVLHVSSLSVIGESITAWVVVGILQ